ncbi:MAG: hypothetical protein JXR64_06910, partial [Spirochaetales bacterium]|nr:hypothetical protein [Spirochaetales bacterium]
MNKNILWGNQPINQIEKCVKEEFVTIENDLFYKIENYTEIEPFFMTLTSNTNHWMFLSSTGGVTTGRVNSESSLFPYYTDDRITENITNTGPKTIILVTKDNNTYIWEPFTQFSNEIYNTSNNLYKNTLGNRVIFEEINNTLGVKFSYSWMNSRKFGIVRESVLTNLSDTKIEISLVDGVQNVLPAGVDSQIQNEFSCLLNGYKRTELDPTGVGLFTLSATLTDLAEPSESLKTNTIWQTGLEVKSYLLESSQLNKFRKGEELSSQTDVKGDRGAYFVESQFILNSKESKNWLIVLDVEKDLTELEKLKNIINYNDNILNSVKEDVALGSKELTSILNQNDGLQVSNKSMNSVHHQANILFNIMRGGYFSDSYNIDINDFADFIKITNINVYKSTESELLKLDHKLDYNQVKVFVDKMKDSDLQRIWVDYLPLTFSRRHGDPSRPWNKFSIETEKEDGSAKLDYQGNWRDIFQNWEALCYSYPKYLKHVIGKFFNASTMDGYNPYRVSRNGIDWECPEPGNPWANIGYWSDHQIIYLLKLLELYKSHKPKD